MGNCELRIATNCAASKQKGSSAWGAKNSSLDTGSPFTVESSIDNASTCRFPGFYAPASSSNSRCCGSRDLCIVTSFEEMMVNFHLTTESRISAICWNISGAIFKQNGMPVKRNRPLCNLHAVLLRSSGARGLADSRFEFDHRKYGAAAEGV